eukprot:scaffold293346_cov11-Tisochrysis_lutea.AAC.2
MPNEFNSGQGAGSTSFLMSHKPLTSFHVLGWLVLLAVRSAAGMLEGCWLAITQVQSLENKPQQSPEK